MSLYRTLLLLALASLSGPLLAQHAPGPAPVDPALYQEFFCAVSDIPWDPPVMARLTQRAENAWVAVNCGIMDPLVSSSGRDGHALLIDCRSLAITPVAIPSTLAVAVLDTMTRRDLVTSAYNERRAQCDAAARTVGVPALRDADEVALERARPHLDSLAYRRARHVVSENRRTLEAAKAMAAGLAAAFGRLMIESHWSLRDDFEVSSAALDTMVDCALEAGCHGARMTGAGFGGCCVALGAKYKYDAAMGEFLYKEYGSIFDFLNLRMLIEGSRLNVFGRLDKSVRRYFQDRRARQILEYAMVFLGTDPAQAPALYSIMSHVDLNLGVHYPSGGLQAVGAALARLAAEQGVEIRLNQEVRKIVVENGTARKVLTDQAEYGGEVVLVNADYAFAETRLLDPRTRATPRATGSAGCWRPRDSEKQSVVG